MQAATGGGPQQKSTKKTLLIIAAIILVIVIVGVLVGTKSTTTEASEDGILSDSSIASSATSDATTTTTTPTVPSSPTTTTPTSSAPTTTPTTPTTTTTTTTSTATAANANPFLNRYIIDPKKNTFFVDSDGSIRKVTVDLSKSKMPASCPDVNDYTATDFSNPDNLALYNDPALLEFLAKGTLTAKCTYDPAFTIGSPLDSTGVCKPIPADRPPAFVSASEDSDFSFTNSPNYKTSPSASNTTINTALLSDYEAISYLTAYPDVEQLITSDRSVNLNIARKHFLDNGSLPAKRVNFFNKVSGKTTTYVFAAPSPKPISELTVTLNGKKFSSLADIRDILRNRLTTIYTWIQTALTITEATYNKKEMTTAEYDACNELLRKCMVLMFGTYGDPIDSKGNFQMDKVMKITRPQLPEPIEVNGVVANYIYLNGQWYAITVSRISAWSLLDTRTSRMIYNCTNAAGTQPGCTAGASDSVCDFVQTGFPASLDSSPCDPDTIYSRYALLVQYNVRMRQERARQLDPYKRQKKSGSDYRCYHKDVSGAQSKMPSPSGDKDTWGYWYKYDAGPKGLGCNKCRGGYESYDKTCQCRVKYHKGKCDTKSNIRTVAMNFLQGSKEPAVYSAPQTDVDDS